MRFSTIVISSITTLLLSLPCVAKGPEKIATLDRSLWPQKLTSSQQYNLASQHEIKRFAQIIATTPLGNAQQIQAFTLLEKINHSAVSRWLAKTKNLLLNNYNLAADECDACSRAQHWQQLSRIEDVLITQNSKPLKEWHHASGSFFKRYLYEQIRLAALFPRISSEIDTLSNNEITGHEFKDSEFLLTFDDGPSSNERTEKLIGLLDELDIHSFFFVMGEKVTRSSKDLKQTYANQCLGSHGFLHKSHQKWNDWQDSLDKTTSALSKISIPPFWFRPPYGQRTQEVSKYLSDQNSRVMLWNIDSQDWNRKLSDQQALDRVVTLMLVWRKGIILYHDIHTKALFALPKLNQLKLKTQFEWRDCREMALLN